MPMCDDHPWRSRFNADFETRRHAILRRELPTRLASLSASKLLLPGRHPPDPNTIPAPIQLAGRLVAPHFISLRPKQEEAVARVVRFHKTGGPEVLKIEELDVGAPKNGCIHSFGNTREGLLSRLKTQAAIRAGCHDHA